MRILCTLTLALIWCHVAGANQEITVELPGGATMEMVWIEPGTFVMGSTEEQLDFLRENDLWDSRYVNESPAHEVTITQGFYLGKYELTQEQWISVMGTKPWVGDANTDVQDDPLHPAADLDIPSFLAFMERLNETAGTSSYRLPTEAEWEYACRAGTTTLWFFGDDPAMLGDYAWYSENDEGHAHEVGAKLGNAWGLHDMYGNVWEMTQDWFTVNYYSESPAEDPQGPESGDGIAIRGGGYGSRSQAVRSGRRNGGGGGWDAGIRLVKTGPQVTAVMSQTWGQVKAAVPSE